MLGEAEKLWQQTLETLRPYLRDGVPIVGLEPSCVAAFRDELVNLFSNDEDAKRLSHNTFMPSEYLERQRYVPPKLKREAVMHGHCQHKALMKMDAEIAVLKKMDLDMDVLDAGCCGMAGSFGFSQDKYDISMRAGEQILLPKIREADDETLIIMDGFSCKEQTEGATGRQGMHLAQVLQLALHEGDRAPEPYPERRNYNRTVHTGPDLGVGLGLLVLGGGLLAARTRQHSLES